MPKLKSHKGVLKRMKVTARGKVKYQRVGGQHLKSHKPGKRVRQLRRAKTASPDDLKRLGAMLRLPLRRQG